MSKMFPFITHTHNLLKYCGYGCTYGWCSRFRDSAPILHKERLAKRFPKGSFVFLNDCGDMMHPEIPYEHIEACYWFMRQSPEAQFLLLTKNPGRYSTITPPTNAVLGATIESDLHYPEVSNAPPQYERMNCMWLLSARLWNKCFISVEPILKFSDKFADLIIATQPWAVAIGYGHYNNRLPEPSLSDTEQLIALLESRGITVYRKTLRKAWWEGS